MPRFEKPLCLVNEITIDLIITMDSFTKHLDKATPQELFDLLLQLNESAKGSTDPVEKDLLLKKISLLKDKVGQFEIKMDIAQGSL